MTPVENFGDKIPNKIKTPNEYDTKFKNLRNELKDQINNPTKESVLKWLKNYKDFNLYAQKNKDSSNGNRYVFAIQGALNLLGYNIAVDSFLQNYDGSSETMVAIRQFQTKWNNDHSEKSIMVDGLPGPETVGALIASLESATVKRVVPDPDIIDLSKDNGFTGLRLSLPEGYTVDSAQSLSTSPCIMIKKGDKTVQFQIIAGEINKLTAMNNDPSRSIIIERANQDSKYDFKGVFDDPGFLMAEGVKMKVTGRPSTSPPVTPPTSPETDSPSAQKEFLDSLEKKSVTFNADGTIQSGIINPKGNESGLWDKIKIYDRITEGRDKNALRAIADNVGVIEFKNNRITYLTIYSNRSVTADQLKAFEELSELADFNSNIDLGELPGLNSVYRYDTKTMYDLSKLPSNKSEWTYQKGLLVKKEFPADNTIPLNKIIPTLEGLSQYKIMSVEPTDAGIAMIENATLYTDLTADATVTLLLTFGSEEKEISFKLKHKEVETPPSPPPPPVAVPATTQEGGAGYVSMRVGPNPKFLETTVSDSNFDVKTFDFSKITDKNLTQKTAEILIQKANEANEIGIAFNSLPTIPNTEIAKEFAKFKGNFYFTALTAMSLEVANEFANFAGEGLFFDQLILNDSAVAAALAKSNAKEIHLREDVPSIPALMALNTYTGKLSLTYEALKIDQVAALVNFAGEELRILNFTRYDSDKLAALGQSKAKKLSINASDINNSLAPLANFAGEELILREPQLMITNVGEALGKSKAKNLTLAEVGNIAPQSATGLANFAGEELYISKITNFDKKTATELAKSKAKKLTLFIENLEDADALAPLIIRYRGELVLMEYGNNSQLAGYIEQQQKEYAITQDNFTQNRVKFTPLPDGTFEIETKNAAEDTAYSHKFIFRAADDPDVLEAVHPTDPSQTITISRKNNNGNFTVLNNLQKLIEGGFDRNLAAVPAAPATDIQEAALYELQNVTSDSFGPKGSYQIEIKNNKVTLTCIKKGEHEGKKFVFEATANPDELKAVHPSNPSAPEFILKRNNNNKFVLSKSKREKLIEGGFAQQ